MISRINKIITRTAFKTIILTRRPVTLVHRYFIHKMAEKHGNGSPDKLASVPVTNDPALEAGNNSTTSTAWNFVALLDIPKDADPDDVGSSLREAGMESQGVHVFQMSNHPPPSSPVRTCATASVRPITGV